MICPQCYSTLEVREATVSCYTCGYTLELEYDHCLEKDCDICSPSYLIKLNIEADQAEREGAYAFQNAKHECPYPKDDPLYVAWYQGYRNERDFHDRLSTEYSLRIQLNECKKEMIANKKQLDELDNSYRKILYLVGRYIMDYNSCHFFVTRWMLRNKFFKIMREILKHNGMKV